MSILSDIFKVCTVRCLVCKKSIKPEECSLENCTHLNCPEAKNGLSVLAVDLIDIMNYISVQNDVDHLMTGH